jgi:hypothetical protein
MKKIIFSFLFLFLVLALQAQQNKTVLLQNLEKNQPSGQNAISTATIKKSTRLFGTKNDLTSVIMIIPAGSTVTVLAADSTYLHVTFEENEGYIFKRHAVIDRQTVTGPQANNQQQVDTQSQPEQEQQSERYTFLENKYGSNMAARLMEGKIWKGINSEMVKDSWGSADKINRIVSGNVIKEEWIYRNTWLYFENNTLLEWGPVKK